MALNLEELVFEKELAAEDSRIAEYFRRLPALLDLPGENEAILDKIEKKQIREGIKLSRKSVLPIELQKFSTNFDNENLEEYEDEPPYLEIYSAKVEYGYLLENLKQIITKLLLQYAKNEKKRLNNQFLVTICRANKIYNLLADLLIVTFDKKNLRNTVARRIVKEISLLSKSFDELEIKSHNSLNFQLEKDSINLLRSEIIKIIFS